MLQMKNKKHLTQEQRYKLEAYLKAGWKQYRIAEELGVHKSTISRELKRNKLTRGGYNGTKAQVFASERKERFGRKRKFTQVIRKFIDQKIKEEQWSPEQISGYCLVHDISMVSIERIYQYIRLDKANGGSLYKYLRHQLKHRKRPVGAPIGGIKDRVGIEKRPGIVDEKSRFGDFEIDTIIGKDQKGAIVTIVERKNGFLLMEKLEKGKDADGLKDAVIRMLRPYKGKIHTITSDNGKEFARHKEIAKALNIDFFFADPYSSWQRGLNEYTNKLIRQYIPKKTNFDDVNNMQIRDIQYKINKRPRKKLNYQMPYKTFFASLNNYVALVT